MDTLMIKILYAEDEPFLGKIVQESLESRQFQVRMVSDGAKVIAAFDVFQPDICVLDVMLPNLSGFEIGTLIRQKSLVVPIIYLTAKTQTEDVLQGFQSGGNDFIRKPFSMEELIVRIQNLLELRGAKQPKPLDPDSIVLGEYTFDPRKYELRKGEVSKKLSHREAELLKILVAHRNVTLERKTILQHIWGDDSFFNSRNLDVYITRLREYLKDDPKVQIITLKGVGYQFVTT
jgi:DNA-binding response OmpR family regulator